MEKIPTIFERGNRFKVVGKPHPDCAWVFAGEGIATEKLDGTNVRITALCGAALHIEKRRNPTKAEKAQGVVDGSYVPASGSAPEDRWIFAAVFDLVRSWRE